MLPKFPTARIRCREFISDLDKRAVRIDDGLGAVNQEDSDSAGNGSRAKAALAPVSPCPRVAVLHALLVVPRLTVPVLLCRDIVKYSTKSEI